MGFPDAVSSEAIYTLYIVHQVTYRNNNEKMIIAQKVKKTKTTKTAYTLLSVICSQGLKSFTLLPSIVSQISCQSVDAA